jgi:uncharacterized membrane protein (Fun14 family)
MTENPVQVPTGMLESIKDSIKLDSLIQKIKDSKELILWGAIYGGAGFVAGFFFKQYSRYLVALLLFIGALLGLQYLDVLSITVHHEKLASFFGIQAALTHDTMLLLMLEWIKANVCITISFAIGFLLGIHAG